MSERYTVTVGTTDGDEQIMTTLEAGTAEMAVHIAKQKACRTSDRYKMLRDWHLVELGELR